MTGLSTRQARRRRAAGISLTHPALSGPSRVLMTQREMAGYHGISARTVKRRKAAGMHPSELVARALTKAQPVTIEGVLYASMRAAGRALGMSDKSVAILRDSTEESVD